LRGIISQRIRGKWGRGR